MHLLSHLLITLHFLSSLALSQPPCDYWNTYGPEQKACSDRIQDFVRRIHDIEDRNLNASSERQDFLKELCQEIQDCRAQNPCMMVNDFISRQLDLQCGNLELYVSNVPKCLLGVFRSIYEQKASGEHRDACLVNFDILSFNLDVKSSVFNSPDGKSCFQQLLNRECSSYSIQYINSHYSEITSMLTDKETNCDTISSAVSKLECVPIVEDLFLKSKVLNVLSSDEERAEVQRLCNQNVECLANACSTESADFKTLCRGFELEGTSLWKCADTYLKSGTPDIQVQQCFQTGCDNKDQQRSCLKAILDEKCSGEGEGAVEEYLDMMTSVWFYCPS